MKLAQPEICTGRRSQTAPDVKWPQAGARPAIIEKRLSLSPRGRVRYQLKMPWKNGTTHVEFEPVGFIAKLAALVPPPRAHCGGAVRIVASIEEPTAIRAILAHFAKHCALELERKARVQRRS